MTIYCEQGNLNTLFKIGYGLYVLPTNEQGKDNGCIVNTVMQITSEPCQIAVCVNKNNYTCEIIQHTKKFNVFFRNKNLLDCFCYVIIKGKRLWKKFCSHQNQ